MRAFLQQVLYANFDLRGHKQLTSLRQHQYILTFKKLLISFYRSATSQIFYKEFFWKCFRNSQENNLSRISYFNQQPFWKVILPKTISLKYLNLFTETVFQSIFKCVFLCSSIFIAVFELFSLLSWNSNQKNYVPQTTEFIRKISTLKNRHF